MDGLEWLGETSSSLAGATRPLQTGRIGQTGKKRLPSTRKRIGRGWALLGFERRAPRQLVVRGKHVSVAACWR